MSGDHNHAGRTCDEQTVVTQDGKTLDWSVPRFCNRPEGHDGGHVYESRLGRKVASPPSAVGREVLHSLLICCGPIPEGGTRGCRGCDAARGEVSS